MFDIMEWKPLPETQLWDELNAAWKRMTPSQRKLWEVIRIDPQKWQQHPYGDLGGGFWAVALIGRTVIWYNDIEDGFNRSAYTSHGVIDEYWSNQDELEWTVQYILNEIADGYDSAPRFGPPQPGLLSE